MPRAPREAIDRSAIDVTASYSVPAVSHCVGWSAKWLRQLIREGRVKAFRPNGHEWRIPGDEVKRICESLERHGTLPGGRRAALPDDQVQVVRVTPEQARKMGVAPAEGAQEDGKGFWAGLDDDVRQGFPLLFGGGSAKEG